MPILFNQYLAQIAGAVNGEDVDFGVDLLGRVNWNQLVILGHSNGGEGVNWIVDGRADHTTQVEINEVLTSLALPYAQRLMLPLAENWGVGCGNGSI